MKNHRSSLADPPRKALRLLALTGLVALTACASAPPEVTYYLLRPPAAEGSGPVDAALRAGLGRVVVAPYLERTQGIAIETRDGEIHFASQYQWAEGLAAGLRWYLRDAVEARLGHPIGDGLARRDQDYTIDVFVARLHGTMTGRAVLDASFIVRGGEDAPGAPGLYEYRFSESIALPEEGYAGVVEAEKALLGDLAGRIADALRGRIEAGETSAGG